MSARAYILAIAAGLGLADASIVTLALPDILRDLNTSVEGVAAVIGVYTVVLAITLIPFERAASARAARRRSAPRRGWPRSSTSWAALARGAACGWARRCSPPRSGRRSAAR